MRHHEDTIAAIATPIGEGGISVIRVSGTSAFEIADSIFRGKTTLETANTHTAHFGYVVDTEGEPLDEVVATVYRSPHSYTAEDCVEISCHGGILVTKNVLEAILHSGARLADPGEFTKRAFLNGRIDLSQAEAVADLIQSRSALAHRSSLRQLEGHLSNKINNIRGQLIDASSLLELELDFAEEDIELAGKQEIRKRIDQILNELRGLIDSFSFGKVCREGVKVVIAGKPNVGKSSILNALLNENRAIVTEIPGTTRDTIEENLSINGVLFKVVDTAGLREASDLVEKEGVRRTESQICSSDLILLVFDISQPPTAEDFEVLKIMQTRFENFESRSLVLLNKLDLTRNGQGLAFSRIDPLENIKTIRVSALTREGLDELKQAMVDHVFVNQVLPSDSTVTITDVRHKDALDKATKHLVLALESLDSKKSGEFIALDIRAALDFLGEIVGVVTTDEILDNIFSRFCIGK